MNQRVEKPTAPVGADAPALVDAAIEPVGQSGPRLDPAPEPGRQRATNLLDAWMEIFCHLQDVVVGNANLAADARGTGRARLEIGDADHVVVAHRIGEIFRGRNGEGQSGSEQELFPQTR